MSEHPAYNNVLNRLIGSNILPKQAKAIAIELEQLERNTSKYYTNDINRSIHNMSIVFDQRIALLKSELLKWFIGVSLIQTASFITTLISALGFITERL